MPYPTHALRTLDVRVVPRERKPASLTSLATLVKLVGEEAMLSAVRLPGVVLQAE